MELLGKSAVVTGGGSGIGLAIAEAFSMAGARVWVCDINQDLIHALNESDLSIKGIIADAGLETDVDRLFDTVFEETKGTIDILVNNAGIAGPNGPLEELKLADWEETLRVNLISTFLCTQRVLPLMKQQREGSIVNLSSSAGVFGYPLRTPYASAKWGIVGLTKSLAMEVGDYGIRVNAICPGAVSGPRMDRVIAAEAQTRNLDAETIREQFVSQTSLKCFVEAQDIAQMVLFISSNRGSKISGQALQVDGNTVSLTQNK